MCSASGDPHFTSFDGGLIHFQGTCVYLLAGTRDNIPASLTPFTVLVKTVHMHGKTHVSYVRFIEVEIGEHVVRLSSAGEAFVSLFRLLFVSRDL